jgi:membrane-associated phospholipid phosphatase
LGTIFSSVGPGLYGRLLPDAVDPFAPLMDWLNEVAQIHTIFVIPTMNELWKDYESGTGLINGISAMPSMHVGTSVLFAILGFSAGKKWLGYLMSAFAFLIFIGSIHLGWHYAIDGYAGAAIAVACWWVSGKIVEWDRRKRGVVET